MLGQNVPKLLCYVLEDVSKGSIQEMGICKVTAYLLTHGSEVCSRVTSRILPRGESAMAPSSIQFAEFVSYICDALLHIPNPPITHGFVVGPGRAGIRLIAARGAQPWPVPPVAPVCDSPAQKGANTHIVDIMAIVLAPTDGDHQRAQQWTQTHERPHQIPAHQLLGVVSYAVHTRAMRKDSHLSGEEETEVPQSGEGEGAVARGERAPPVMERMVVRLRADVDRHEGIPRRSWSWDAAGEQVRARSADGILDDIGETDGQGHGDGQPQDGHMVLVRGGLGGGVVDDQDDQGDDDGIDQVEPWEEGERALRLALLPQSSPSSQGRRHPRGRRIDSPMGTLSTSACGKEMRRSLRENMRWNGSTKRRI